MKQVFSILLLVAILAQSFSKLITMWEYSLSKEYIAANLCENRDKPLSCCEGKCQLTKALNEDEGATEKGPVNPLKEKLETPGICFLSSYLPAPFSAQLFVAGKIEPAVQETGFQKSVFHPPAILC